MPGLTDLIVSPQERALLAQPPSEQEMIADLEKADAAGDSALAQHIADKIKASRTPEDTHPTWQKAVHYGAKALPVVGGVAGGVLAGGAGIPTGPGALATGAAGVGLGAASGRAGQKAIDQYLGYEQPDLKRDLIDVGTTGLRDATYATGTGVATAGALKALPILSRFLNSGALATGRRVLTNVSGSLSRAKPLSDEAVSEAFNQGVFKPFGTSGGASQRLDAAREAMGQRYSKIISDLESQGITGPDAQRLAQSFASRAQTISGSTMNPAVPKIYESAAEQTASKPTLAGALKLSQTEDMKRSLQGMAKSAYKQFQPSEVGQAHEDTASMMRQAVEDEIARQTQNASPVAQETAAQFIPVKQQLGNLIEASNASREGMARQAKRSAIALPDWLAATAEMNRSNSLPQAIASAAATHMLRSRGPSTAAVLLRGASQLASQAPAMAPEFQRAAMSMAPAAAEKDGLAALLEYLRRKPPPTPQLAQAEAQ